MDRKKLVKEYLESARLMQVATSVADQPWACSVYFAFDDDFNLYWLSKPTRRHSKEIAQNEKVAGTVVLPHYPGDKVRGIQFQGIAKELTGEEARAGLAVYSDRHGLRQERIEAILERTDGHTCYRITPTLFVLFDEVNFPDDPRQEIPV